MSALLPPLDGSLNLRQIVDFQIAHGHHSAAYSFSDQEGIMIEISHFEFCRAAHRVAHLLRSQRRGPDGQVLAIVAVTDVLIYQTIVAGCFVAGLIPFPISDRSTVETIFHLLSNAGSHRVLTTKGSLGRLVDALVIDNAAYELSVEEIPLLGQIYPHLGHETPESPFVLYPRPTTSISLDDVALYLHSSDGTGFPKYVPQTHSNLVLQAALEGISQRAEMSPRLAVGHLPACHAMGITTQILFPILNGGTACLYPLASTATEYIIPAVPNAQNAIENAQRTKAMGILIVPAFVPHWQSPETIAYLKTLKLVAYTGVSLESRVSESLFNQGVNIVPIYRVTEIGAATVARIAAVEEMIAKIQRRLRKAVKPLQTEAPFIHGPCGYLDWLNRPGKTSVSVRQREAFVKRALDTTLLASEKLIYLEGDSTKADLGLPAEVWMTLRDTATVIIHNAWTVNFNKPLIAFEPHVKGVRNLIDLARQSPEASGLRFFFASSIASAQNWDQRLGSVPEQLQLDASLAIGSGYGESKYIAERILAASGLQATSFRIGQICGSVSNGAWSTTEWFPSIVKIFIALRSFPSHPGVVAWVPPQAVSQTIVDAAVRGERTPFAINLVHPRPVTWDFVMSTMASTLQLPMIPSAQWLQQLQHKSGKATDEDMKRISTIKLLGSFAETLYGMRNVQFSTSKAEMISKSMKSLEPLREEEVKQWIQHWNLHRQNREKPAKL
ncbi:Acetyl-CoA synthetase-like protein [Mycena sanguinolenta]|uniref:Acetyl-CoA synthetase-like protein n=1 Tax=Mycena sanguinolenta TaxID=230812 RepID=A0A8H7D3A7_9AGAR|nr:Acetyl-CoA synthetase-like protein [Mycena sanguinolenta]